MKQLGGKMLWVTGQTGPDPCFETCMICNTGKSPAMKKVMEANKAVSKLKSRNLSIKFCSLCDKNNIDVISYSDATHASLESGASQGAYNTTLKGKDGLIPISWQLEKLD